MKRKKLSPPDKRFIRRSIDFVFLNFLREFVSANL